MIRKLLAATAVMALCVGLVGCEGRSSAPAGGAQGDAAAEKKPPRKAPGSDISDQAGKEGGAKAPE